MTAGPTPSQTVGPFVHLLRHLDEVGPDVVAAADPGAVWLGGQVVDGAGAVVDDAMIETWQADTDGRYASPADPRRAGAGRGPDRGAGFARCYTDEAGRWAIRTRKPGPVPGPDGAVQAPHVVVGVFARGLLQRLLTRVYFPDEAAANAADPILSGLDPAGAATLVAAAADDGYRFDIRLQGDDATVFFVIR